MTHQHGTRKRKADDYIEELAKQIPDLQHQVATIITNLQEGTEEVIAKCERMEEHTHHSMSAIAKRLQEVENALVELAASSTLVTNLVTTMDGLIREQRTCKAMLQTMLDRDNVIASVTLTKSEKISISKKLKIEYHLRKFISREALATILLALPSVPDSKKRPAISHGLKYYRNFRSKDISYVKIHIDDMFPGGLIEYFTSSTAQQKTLHERMCTRMYKAVTQFTSTDLDWMDTLLCRHVMLKGENESFMNQHNVDIVAKLKAKPYWRSMKTELRKEIPEFNYDSEGEREEVDE